jgi:hypothetical protein
MSAFGGKADMANLWEGGGARSLCRRFDRMVIV